jgi:hypothetical protein
MAYGVQQDESNPDAELILLFSGPESNANI